MGDVPPLPYSKLAPLATYDAVCLNFITGFEMSLETLVRFRASTALPIFMDVHSLTLGIDSQRRRFLCHPENWQDWVRIAHVVQLNEMEACLLADRDLASEAAIRQFGQVVLELGAEALVITLGASGSLTVYRNTSDEMVIMPVDAAPAGPVVDTTGCGDAFLAGFTLAYLHANSLDREGRLLAASRFANRVAGANCALSGTEEMAKLATLVARNETGGEA